MRSGYQLRLVSKKNKYTEKDWYNNYFHNDYKYGPKTKSRSGYTWSKKMADDVLFVCTSCKVVWELESRTNNIAYYDDFPTLGKKRKECPKCKNRSH